MTYRNEPRRLDRDRRDDPRPPRPRLDPARTKIVLDHLDLAWALARPFHGPRGADRDEAEAEAVAELCKQALAWDDKRHVPFSAYCRAGVRGALTDWARRKIRAGIPGKTGAPTVTGLGAHSAAVPDDSHDNPPPDDAASDARFLKMLSTLTDVQARLLTAIYRDDLTQSQAAQLLKISRTTAYVQTKLALELLAAAPTH